MINIFRDLNKQWSQKIQLFFVIKYINILFNNIKKLILFYQFKNSRYNYSNL